MRAAYSEALKTYNDSLPPRSLLRQEEDPLKVFQLRKLVARVPRAGRIVDVGTGTGLVPHALHLLGYSVYSIDAPRLSGTESLERLMDLGVSGAYVEVGVDPLPLEQESCDAVFIGDVIEHLPDSPRRFLEDLTGVLRPGGSVLLSTPNATRLTVRAKVVFGFSNWPSIEDYFDEPCHGGHHKEYTASELRTVLARVGLTSITVEYVENRIMTAPCARIRDIKTQGRTGVDFERPTGSRHIAIRAARHGAMVLVRLAPRLASVLVASAQKPSMQRASRLP